MENALEPTQLVASADEIDSRLGPIPGRSSDRIARELRSAAALIIGLQRLLDEARQYVADAGSDEDSEAQANSAALLAEIDQCLGRRPIHRTPQDGPSPDYPDRHIVEG